MSAEVESKSPTKAGEIETKADLALNQGTLRFLHQTQQRSYWETANLTAKGIAFYLAVTAALLSYTLTQKLEPALASLLLWGALAISAAVFAALGANAWLLFHQAKSLEALSLALDKDAFEALSFSRHARNERRVLVIVISAYCAVGAALVTGILLLLRRFS